MDQSWEFQENYWSRLEHYAFMSVATVLNSHSKHISKNAMPWQCTNTNAVNSLNYLTVKNVTLLFKILIGCKQRFYQYNTMLGNYCVKWKYTKKFCLLGINSSILVYHPGRAKKLCML